MPKLTCSKVFSDLPFAHRQHKHTGHCSLIHGHNWSFKITFTADSLDSNGFVVDFGMLKFMKTWINNRFDHTLVLNEDDPFLEHLMFNLDDVTDTINSKNKTCGDLARIIIVPNCGAEGLAVYLYKELNSLLAEIVNEEIPIDIWKEWRSRYLRILEVTVYEDSKNSATYKNNE